MLSREDSLVDEDLVPLGSDTILRVLVADIASRHGRGLRVKESAKNEKEKRKGEKEKNIKTRQKRGKKDGR